MEIKKYDILVVDFGDDNFEGEQAGIRPCVVVQNNKGNEFSCTTLVMPLTSQPKKLNQPTHFILYPTESNCLRKQSVVLGECLRQISKERIIKKVGRIIDSNDKKNLKRIYDANFGED